MTNATIYHNPRCSKSRQALKLLQDNHIDPTIVEYLKTPPSKAALKKIITQLNISPRDLLRKKESAFAENNLADTPPPAPKPVVQEGIILPDGTSARVSREDDAQINIGQSSSTGPIRTLEAIPLGKGKYAIRIPGFEDHQIVLKTASFARSKLLYDGEVVQKEKGSKSVALTSVGGLIAKIEMRPSILDPLPQVWVDGEKLIIAPPIKWYQWVWVSVPLIALIVLGTFVGAIFGIPAMLLNIQIFRSRLSVVLQYVFSFLLTLAAVVLYMLTATYLSSILLDFTSNF